MTMYFQWWKFEYFFTHFILNKSFFSDDFDLDPNLPLPGSIMKYLFDAAPQMNGRTNEYLHAVNLIYQVIKVFVGVWSQLWPKVWQFLRLTRTGVKLILVSICFSPSQYHSATQSWPQLGEVHHCTLVSTNLSLPQSQTLIHAAAKKILTRLC